MFELFMIGVTVAVLGPVVAEALPPPTGQLKMFGFYMAAVSVVAALALLIAHGLIRR